MAMFAAIIVLFLGRAASDAPDDHPIWKYLVPSVGCALTNYLGNEGWHVIAIPLFLATGFYIIRALRPL